MQRLFFSNFDVGQQMKSVVFLGLLGVSCKLAANGSGIGGGGDFQHKSSIELVLLNLAQMFHRSTLAPLLAIPC